MPLFQKLTWCTFLICFAFDLLCEYLKDVLPFFFCFLFPFSVFFFFSVIGRILQNFKGVVKLFFHLFFFFTDFVFLFSSLLASELNLLCCFFFFLVPFRSCNRAD